MSVSLSGAFRAKGEFVKDAGVIISVCGILLVYGVLQERIMTVGFGPQAEIFENSIFLVLCNRLVTCLMALTYILCTEHDTHPTAPLKSYAAVSFSNLVASTCQYEALKYVSFAVQTLAKSAKVIPVMLWGTVFFGRRYKVSEFLHAVLITVGCSIFVMAGDVASRVQMHHSSSLSYTIGALLMMLYLAVDGLTSTWQDSLFTGYNMSICDQVLYTTTFSTVIAIFASVGTSQFWSSVMFVVRNPDSLWWILALSIASAGVQLVISYTIKKYGAVVFATVMTTRQFLSVLASSLVFWTPFTIGQWFGLFVVFGAMYWRVYRKGPGKGKVEPSVVRTSKLVGSSGGNMGASLSGDKGEIELLIPKSGLSSDHSHITSSSMGVADGNAA